MTREEALKELAEWREQMKNHGVPDYGKKLMALGVALEALSADTKEVVRCRDCMHYRPDADPAYERCRHHIIYMEPEDWCSYGERREP